MKPIWKPWHSWRGLLGSARRRLAQRRWRSARRLSESGLMWGALLVAFLAVVMLGTVGYTAYYQQHPEAERTLTTRVYQSVQLFGLDGPELEGPVPWPLDVARFAALLVAVFAIVQALAAVFRTQMESLRLHLVRDHVVVAGYGRKGQLLAQALLRRGERVVVIEADDSNAELDSVRAVGGLVVVGDARTAETQRRARVGWASHVVALCGDDDTNTEIVAVGREHARRTRSGNLQCVAQLVDPDMCLLLSCADFEHYGEAPARVDFVNVYAAGADDLLRAHPPWVDGAGRAPEVLLLGAGPTAAHVLAALARAWATRPDAQVGQQLAVTVVGPDASSLSALLHRHPEVEKTAHVHSVPDLRSGLAGPLPGIVYVCPDDDAAATSIGAELRRLLSGTSTQIVIVFKQRSGLGHFVHSGPPVTESPSVATYGLLEETCQPEVMLTGTTELLAQALHNAYLNMHTDTAATGTDPALQPWDQLPETLRESNRDQAAHVAVKLAAVGCVVGPLVDWDAARREFCEAEVEVMARLEHDRWVKERREAGWRPGPRDPNRRTTPYLVPWEQLTEEIRDSDRMFVRELPRLLASVGLQAHRWGGAALHATSEAQHRP